jgi:alpha-D-xyloside xylohydrolase
MTFLRTSGFKVVVWLTPFVNVRSNDEAIPGQNLGRASTYAAAAAAGYFVRQSPNGPPLVTTWWKGDGSPVDFTNPAARTWFQDQLRQLVEQSGGVIAGFKTDDGEADYIPLTASYADGRTGVEMKNGYSVEYLRAVWNVLGSDGIVFARSGFTGTQAFPAIWAGDNEPNYGTNGLPSVVPAALSSAMSGYALWASDIGGYQDANPSSAPEDLFMRWTQLGALSPIMQVHRQVGAGRQYPWSYGDVAFEHYRAYAQLHTTLFPYLYTLAKQASVDGIPLIRPLPLVATDPDAFAHTDEYLLGDDLLVAPVLEKQVATRPVYLPPGGWFDFWTQAYLDGGQTVTWSGDPTQMPLYVRAGAIVPRVPADVQSLADTAYVDNPEVRTWDGALDLLVYPSDESHVTVYDGTEITCRSTTSTTSIALTSTPRVVELAIYSSSHPRTVTRDGALLAEVAPDAYQGASDAWTYDGGFVRIRIAHAGGSAQLELDGTARPQDTDGQPAGCGCAADAGDGRGAIGWLVLAVGCAWLAGRRRGSAS